MITFKLTIAIIAFILSSGQIVLQTFQHHHALNPKHGAIKFMVFILSSLSLVYLAKDIYSDFDAEKNPSVAAAPAASPAELDYWHGIDREASPEGYCGYLEKYPQGQFAAVATHRIPGDCFQVKRQAEAEAKRKSDEAAAALKEKLDNETKVLAEKNALLEQQAQKNAVRLDVTEAELAMLKAKAELNAEAQINAESKAKAESGNSSAPTLGVPGTETEKQPEPEPKSKPAAEAEEPLF